MKEKESKGVRLLENFVGDKVVLLIVLLLCMFSLLSIFSSTSQLASDTTSRLDIAKDQFLTIAIGLGLIWIIYRFLDIKTLKFFSKIGFIVAFGALCILQLTVKHKLSIPFITAPRINGANRWLRVFKVSVSVYEVVKVAMVMYVAWAIDKIQSGGIKILERLAARTGKPFFAGRFGQELIVLFIPTMVVTVMILTDGASSAFFTGLILFIIMLVCGIRFGDMLILALIALFSVGCCFGLFKLTEDKANPLFPRFATVFGDTRNGDHEERIKEMTFGSAEFYKALDPIRQPYGAKIAIKQGGLKGKGPGQSTQKYKVSVMYEDYMFSFLVEEYGLVLGGIAVIFLYISLLARASIITRNFSDNFGKIMIAGTTILIVGQAMFHIYINCDLGIRTGQTLPLISYGKSSFFCFCITFGIILAISKMASAKVQDEVNRADSIIEFEDDKIRGSLNDLEYFEENGQ